MSSNRAISIGCTIGAVPGCALLIYTLIARGGAEQPYGWAFGVAFWAVVLVLVGAALGGKLGVLASGGGGPGH